MIFVMLGTQKHEFRRLLKEIDKLDTSYEVVVQKGYTEYHNNAYEVFDFINESDFKSYIQKADIIITHGGAGSIFTALNMNKKVLVMPRLKKYNEHINDHQLELCEKLYEMGYIELLNSDINNLIKKIQNKEYKKYEKSKSYITKLKECIDNI